MIDAITTALKKMLAEELGLDEKQVACDALAEAEARTDTPRLNLYFYNVQENRAYRDDSFHVMRKPGGDGAEVSRRRGAVTLDYSYLLTVYAGKNDAKDGITEHRLLSQAMMTLLKHNAVPPKFFRDLPEMREHGVEMLPLSAVQPEQATPSEIASLWQSLGGRSRPALGITVTCPCNPFTPQPRRLVQELVVGMGIGVPELGPLPPLQLSGWSVTLAGIVVQAGRQNINGAVPLENVKVTLRSDEKGKLPVTETDGRGVFCFLDQRPGNYTLHLECAGYCEAEIPITIASQQRMEPMLITLRSIHPSLTEAEEPAPLSYSQTPTSLVAAKIESQKPFIQSAAERLKAQTDAVNLMLDTPRVMEQGRTLRLALTGRLARIGDGTPAAYLTVKIISAKGITLARTVTDAEGCYYFLKVPSEPYKIVYDVPDQTLFENTLLEQTEVPAEKTSAAAPKRR